MLTFIATTSRTRIAHRCLLIALFCLSPLAQSPRVSAAELTNDQKQQLNSALSDLRQAKANYDLVAKSVSGSTKLSGGRAKLAMVRLDSAQASLDKASKQLAGLPADQANVKAAADAHASIASAIAKLKQQLTNPSAPKPGTPTPPTKPGTPTTPPTKPTPTTPAPPLSAAVRKQLEQVDLALRMADVTLDNLAPAVDQLLADATSPASAIQNAGNQVMQTNAKLQQAKATLLKLPQHHPKVVAAIAAWKIEIARVKGVANKLLPRWNEIQKVAGGDKLANFSKDIEMLKGLEVAYRDQTPQGLAQTLANDKAVVDKLKQISATYKPMIDQKTNEGNAMAFQMQRLVGKRQVFLTSVKNNHPHLISRIQQMLSEVKRLRTEAVEEKKPLYLTGGIESMMTSTNEWIAVLNAYAPKQAAPFIKTLADERQAVAEARVTLKETIIQANPLPSNNYTGEDREKLIQLAMASWKKEQPDAKVLAVRIPAEAWKRMTRWEGKARDGFKIEGSKVKVKVEMTKYDNSRIQIQLIVADSNPNLAVIRPVNIWKNHTNNDKVTAYNFRSIKDKLQPNEYLLRNKVK